MRRRQRGVSLVEILISIVIISVASIATLTYFAYAKGGVAKQGNRRAALERARQRLDQLMEANPDDFEPTVDPGLPQDSQPVFWLSCAGSPCAWSLHSSSFSETGILVEDLGNQQMETTVQWKDDLSAGTTTPDVLELGVKVWYMPGTPVVDDEFHRVHVRTLRAPS